MSRATSLLTRSASGLGRGYPGAMFVGPELGSRFFDLRFVEAPIQGGGFGRRSDEPTVQFSSPAPASSLISF